VLGQVAVALEVGQHAQDGDELASLQFCGLSVDQFSLNRVRDSGDQFVDDLVSLDEQLRGVAVTCEESVGCTGDTFADEREDLCEEAVDLVGLWFGAGPQGFFVAHLPPDAI